MGGQFFQKFLYRFFYTNTLFWGLSPLFDCQNDIYRGGIRGRGPHIGGYRGMRGYLLITYDKLLWGMGCRYIRSQPFTTNTMVTISMQYRTIPWFGVMVNRFIVICVSLVSIGVVVGFYLCSHV